MSAVSPVGRLRAATPKAGPEHRLDRHPGDLARLLWSLALVGLGLLALFGASQTTTGLERDLLQLVARLPEPVLIGLVLLVQAAALVLIPGIPLAMIVLGRWRRLGVYLLGYVLTSVLMALARHFLTFPEASALPGYDRPAELYQSWPPVDSIAASVTAMILLSPNLNRAWRRFGWGFVALLALTEILTASTVVLDLPLAASIGALVGYGLLFAFGRRIAVPTSAQVAEALERIGLGGASVAPSSAAATGSMPFSAVLPDGRRLHCKVLLPTQYEADRLMRGYRRFRLQSLGEDKAYSTIRRAAGVEALLNLLAAREGVLTPYVHGVAPLDGDEQMVIAFEHVDGVGLDAVDPSRLTDPVLDSAWQQIAALRRAGLAHRDLQLSSWMLDAQDRLWLIDYSFGEPAASEGAQISDIAEFLAASYAVVGAQRAVAAAVRALGPQTVAEGLSYLVPVALSRPTRAAVKSVPDGLAPLVAHASEVCGVEPPKVAPIERVKPRTLLMAGLLVVAVYVLLPQLTDLPQMIEAIRSADGRFAAAAIVAAVLTNIGVGLAIAGAVPVPVRLDHAILAAFASQFVGAVTPPGIGHTGVNVRFVQKQGLPPAVAVSATAAKEVSVGVVHIVLLVLLGFVAGRRNALQEELGNLPALSTVGIVVAIVLAGLGLAAATPQARKFLRETVLPAVKDSLAAMRGLLSSPVKVVMMFGGGLLLQGGFIAALYFSTEALGADVGLVTIGLIYLTVGSAAAVAPTPGGVGAVEAVLLAALTGVGVDGPTALASVFLFRLATFWLPIPVGAAAMKYLTAKDVL